MDCNTMTKLKLANQYYNEYVSALKLADDEAASYYARLYNRVFSSLPKKVSESRGLFKLSMGA